MKQTPPSLVDMLRCWSLRGRARFAKTYPGGVQATSAGLSAPCLDEADKAVSCRYPIHIDIHELLPAVATDLVLNVRTLTGDTNRRFIGRKTRSRSYEVGAAVGQRRNRACVKAKEHHFEHLLN